jgi:hypothetical protein
MIWHRLSEGTPNTQIFNHTDFYILQNRVLRGIFGPKRDEVTAEWRKLHSGKLHNLYSSPDIR